MRSVTVVVAAGLWLLLTALFGAHPGHAQPIASGPPLLRMEITSLAPRIATPDASAVEVSATITNISDRSIANVQARLQLGGRLDSTDELTAALTATAPVDDQRTPFEQVVPHLAPGESAQMTLRADLDGGGFLPSTRGVYPLLVNVNGRPDFGGDARLAGSHLMLPVLSDHDDPPTKLSILWPFTAAPSTVSAVNGDLTLANDDLAADMRSGGRLSNMIELAEAVRSESEVFDSLCFAIDPALVETARAMVSGYEIRNGGDTRAGEGMDDAKQWLEDLRTLVSDHCVISTSYAGAAMATLAAISPTLATRAASGDDILRETLDVEPEPEAFRPGHELTTPALDAMAEAGKEVLLTDPTRLEGLRRDRPAYLDVADRGVTGQRVVPFDEHVTMGFTPGSASPAAGAHATVAADDRAVATQNAVAAIAARAGLGSEAQTEHLLVALPQAWEFDPSEAERILDAIGEYADAGLVDPEPMTELLESPIDGSIRPVIGDAADGTPDHLMQEINQLARVIEDLTDAMDVDPTVQVEPAELVRPLEDGLLRATSTAWLGNALQSERAVSDAEKQIADLAARVEVTDPGRTIVLSGSSPIPVVVTNNLPVRINVTAALTDSPVLRGATETTHRLAAGASINLRIPADVLRAGRFSVDVALSTPGGTPLGEPTRFELASTEFGVVTIIVTITAAGALLLLSTRRIYRRVRGTRGKEEGSAS